MVAANQNHCSPCLNGSCHMINDAGFPSGGLA